MFKKVLISMALTVGAVAGAHAQIPVTDVVSITNQNVNHAASIAKYVEQITQMKAQLEQTKQLYNNLNGLRNVGGLMQDQLLAQNLPPQYQQSYNQLKQGKGGSLAGISGTLNQIAAMYQAQNCNQHATAVARQRCNAEWQNYAMNQYVGEQGYQQAATNIQNLDQFVNSIKSAPDAKTMQDLQARISVEQVKLQNEQMKLQTIQVMQKAQEDMQRRNSTDNTIRMIQGSGTPGGNFIRF